MRDFRAAGPPLFLALILLTASLHIQPAQKEQEGGGGEPPPAAESAPAAVLPAPARTRGPHELASTDFESSGGGFTANPSTAGHSWEWGTPVGGPGGAHSGTKCWATNLTGNYDRNVNWYLTSPAYDLEGTDLAWVGCWFWFDRGQGDYVDVELYNGMSFNQIYHYDADAKPWAQQFQSVGAQYRVNGFCVRFRLYSNNYGYQAWGAAVDDFAVYIDHRPRLENVTVSPQPTAKPGEDLTVAYDTYDPEDDPVTVQVQWYENDQLMSGQTGHVLDHAHVKRGCRYKALLSCYDSYAPPGAPPSQLWGDDVWTNEVLVVNNPPVLSGAALYADPGPECVENTTLRTSFTYTDPDPGDELGAGGSVIYTWFLNGAQLLSDHTSDPAEVTLDSSAFNKGDVVRLQLVPYDGYDLGVGVNRTVVVNNTPPTGLSLSAPSNVSTNDDIVVTIETPSHDADPLDTVTYLIEWTRNGTVQTLSDLTVPHGFTTKHDVWHVRVTPSDGEGTGPYAEATIGVDNAPPTAPSLDVTPHEPSTLENLTAWITGGSDPDGDAVSTCIRWSYRPPGGTDFVENVTDVPSVPANYTAKGQVWRCTVWLEDSEGLAGPEVFADVEVRDSPPSEAAINLSPLSPTTMDDLVVSVAIPSVDPDGDPVSYRVEWARNGVWLPDLTDQWTLPSDLTSHFEHWTVLVTPVAASVEGPNATLTVVVGNLPPSAPALSILPETPSTLDDLCLSIGYVIDPDGDPCTVEWVWYADGSKVGEEGAVVNRSLTAKGQVWTARARAHDGFAYGPEANASVIIRNSRPTVPLAVIEPAYPTLDDDLVVVIVEPSSDPDGDAVTYNYTWYRNSQPSPVSGGTVPAEETSEGDTWRVRVTPFDGEEGGPENFAQVTVGGPGGNRPPSAPVVDVQPDSPMEGDELTCVITSPSTDPDGDEVHYVFEWYKDGSLLTELTQDHVEASFVAEGTVHDGEVWVCRVTPVDERGLRGAYGEDRVGIGNRAPSRPVVGIEPENPAPGQGVRCVIIEAAVDPDGDEVTYWFRWYADGALRLDESGTGSALGLGVTEAGQHWLLVVTPFDGIAYGPPAELRFDLSTPAYLSNGSVYWSGGVAVFYVEMEGNGTPVVVVDGDTYQMNPTGDGYEVRVPLSAGDHDYYFDTLEGGARTSPGTPGKLDPGRCGAPSGSADASQGSWRWLIVLALVILLIIAALVLVVLRRRTAREGPDEEETPIEGLDELETTLAAERKAADEAVVEESLPSTGVLDEVGEETAAETDSGKEIAESDAGAGLPVDAGTDAEGAEAAPPEEEGREPPARETAAPALAMRGARTTRPNAPRDGK